MVRLAISAKGESRTVESAERVLTLGRGAESTVQIHDEGASRKHCAIEQLPDGSYRLTDLASRNGTRLNGERVTEAVLKAGDVILIGSTRIAVEAIAAGTVPPPPAPPKPPERLPHGGLKLVFVAGPNKGQSFVVSKARTALGRRARDNDIALCDTGVSNRHAEIHLGAEGFTLADLGSRNGTLLNGHRVQQSPLKPGDRIQLGRSIIEVHAVHPTTVHLPKPSAAELAPPAAKPPAPEPAPAAAAPPGAPPAPAAAPEVAAGVAPSRRRTLLLAAAIAIAVAFFAAVLIARGLQPRRGAPPPGDKAPAEEPKAKKGDEAPPAKAPTTETPAAPAKKLPAAEDPAAARQKAEAEAALRAARRAELTGEPADFEVAEKMLNSLLASLEGTPQAREAAKALAALGAARQAAAERRESKEAAALLAAAKRHQAGNEPNLARLHCRELIARYPANPAAAEARALLAALDAPAPTPPPPPPQPPAEK